MFQKPKFLLLVAVLVLTSLSAAAQEAVTIKWFMRTSEAALTTIPCCKHR